MKWSPTPIKNSQMPSKSSKMRSPPAAPCPTPGGPCASRKYHPCPLATPAAGGEDTPYWSPPEGHSFPESGSRFLLLWGISISLSLGMEVPRRQKLGLQDGPGSQVQARSSPDGTALATPDSATPCLSQDMSWENVTLQNEPLAL